MRLSNARAAIVVLAVTTVLAQEAPAPVAAPAGTPSMGSRRPLAGRRGMSPGAGQASAGQTLTTMRERMDEMGGTLDKMHTVLKQMRAKAVKAGVKDPIATANLNMWELMLGHLDKQFQDLRNETLAREDLEARRAALYKQADAKAAAEAQRAQSLAGQTPILTQGGQAAGQTPAGQTPPALPANASPSQK